MDSQQKRCWMRIMARNLHMENKLKSARKMEVLLCVLGDDFEFVHMNVREAKSCEIY